MKLRRAIIASVGLAVASLPLVVYGARLREQSPRYDDWLGSLSVGTDLDSGLGLVVGTWWVFVSLCWAVGLFLFVGSLIFFTQLPFELHRRRSLRVGLSLLFAVVCAWGAVAVSVDAASDFRWGFSVLALGECLTGAALGVGIFEGVRMGRTKRST